MMEGESLQIVEDPITDQTYTIFSLSDTERKVFILESDDEYAALWETPDGFVRSATMSEKEAQDFLNQFNSEDD